MWGYRLNRHVILDGHGRRNICELGWLDWWQHGCGQLNERGLGRIWWLWVRKKVQPQEETPKLDVHSCSPPEHEIWDRRRRVQRKRRPWWCKIFCWLENNICTLFGLENTLRKCTYWLEEQICYDFEHTHERMPCNQILWMVNQKRLHGCEGIFLREVNVGIGR